MISYRVKPPQAHLQPRVLSIILPAMRDESRVLCHTASQQNEAKFVRRAATTKQNTVNIRSMFVFKKTEERRGGTGAVSRRGVASFGRLMTWQLQHAGN